MREDLPDPEWLAFTAGIKPTLRISLPVGLAESRMATVRGQGFSAVPSNQTYGRDPEQTVIYVARSEAAALALRDAEAPVFPFKQSKLSSQDRQSAHRTVGAMLGFPSCCVDAFLERVQRGVMVRSSGGNASEDFVAAEDAMSRTQIFFGRLNDLRRRERLWIIPFYPCRYDCDVALNYADRVFAEIVRVAPSAAERLKQELSRPVQMHQAPPLIIPFDRF